VAAFSMFKESLQQVLERTEGSVGVLIMGTDGIAVEKAMAVGSVNSELDDATAAEFTSLVKNAQRTGSGMNLGNLNELVIACEQTNVVIRLLNKDYFLVLAMQPNGNLGRGRYELRKAELVLAREFAL
jgi:predicted regulator of Ras-like GTPase activity (Roadblock/LC7/MglB family)